MNNDTSECEPEWGLRPQDREEARAGQGSQVGLLEEVGLVGVSGIDIRK